MILRDVRKRYRGRGDVLAGVDLELVPGRPVVVLGGNGSGKSTLLRIAAGASAPTAGRVEGRPDVVGYLPAPASSSSRMRARVWLRHQAALRGTPGADPHPVLDALAYDADALDMPLRRLSTGNLRKIALAGAVGGRPPLVVLDEPWNGLDVTAAPALASLLAEVAASSALLLADHTGHAGELPGAVILQLEAGSLIPASRRTCANGPLAQPHWASGPFARGPAGVMVIELRHDGQVDGARLVEVLPAVVSWAVGGGVLTLRVPAERGDAVLAAALARGSSVVRVWREPS